MDEVAKRSGASRPLLYHYFSSKQELIRAVVAHESATLAGSIDSAKLPEALMRISITWSRTRMATASSTVARSRPTAR